MNIISNMQHNTVQTDRETQTKKYLSQAIKEHGEDWVAAAMVDGSIGYYSPRAAVSQIKSIASTGRGAAERTIACFRGDVLSELQHDIERFVRIELDNPEHVAGLKSALTDMIGMDFGKSETLGLLYPTIQIKRKEEEAIKQ